jgi:hypothetical protein
MRTLSGICLLLFAFLLGVMEMAALADPAPTALAHDAEALAPAAPWYAHAMWIATMAVCAWFGARLVNRGILGRLVRGRGFTPAAR